MSACLGCFSRSLLATTRTLMIIWCTLILISQFISIWAMCSGQNLVMEEYLPGYRVYWHEYILCVSKTLLALCGIHGAYAREPQYLKVFALLALSLATCYLLFYSDWPERMWAEKREEFREIMELLASDYEWNDVWKARGRKSEATELWDIVQLDLTCCGLTGPQDWTNNNNFKINQKDWLPGSCCNGISRTVNRVRPDGRLKCTLEDAYPWGCMERMDLIVATSYKRQVVAAVVYSILACWALILARAFAKLVTRRPLDGSQTAHDKLLATVFIKTEKV